MPRRSYYRLCLSLAAHARPWLEEVVAKGPEHSPHMRPSHFLLARLALRNTA